MTPPDTIPTPPSAADAVYGGLSLQRYAEVAAHVRHFAPSDAEALSRLGVPESDWRTADRAFTAAIDAEMNRGECALVMQYAATFRAVRARLAEMSPSLMELSPLVAPVPAAPPSALPEPSLPERAPLESAVSLPREPVRARRRPAVTVAMQSAFGTSALPFQPGALPEERPTESHGSEPVAPNRGPLTGTADLDLQGILAAIPFAAAQKKASLPELTLEQYASLCAELAVTPLAAGETRARYGLASDAAGAALDTAWGQRFTRDPALYARWNELRHRYQSWLIHRSR